MSFASKFAQEKDIEDSEITEVYADILVPIGISEEDLWGFLKTLRLSSQVLLGSIPVIERGKTGERSLAIGGGPEDWRIANAVSLYKGGNRENPRK